MKPTDNLDLGKYDLNQLLRDPSLVHKIQDALLEIKGDGFLHEALRNGAKKNIKETITTIISQYRDNPKLITEIVGKKTLGMIEDFTGTTLADDIKGIL